MFSLGSACVTRTMMKGAAALALTFGLMAPLAAQAQSVPTKPADVADMKCLALLVTIVEMGGEASDQVMPGVFYYLGRLEGRTPSTNWLQATEDYRRGTPVETLAGDAERCSQELMAKGNEMIAFGETQAQQP